MEEPTIEIQSDGREIHTHRLGTLDMSFLKSSLEGPNIADLIKAQLKDEYKDWMVWVDGMGSDAKEVTIMKVVPKS